MRFSIVTVCYNASRTIAGTLQSVAAQTWPDIEHIIIDGASTDETLEVITAHAHPRLLLHSEPDRGIYDAMNKGLSRATGDYVLFLNADDFLANRDVVRTIALTAQAHGTDLIIGDTLIVDAVDVNLPLRYYGARNFSAWWLKIGVMPPHPSTFARRTLLNAAGGFDCSYDVAADFDLIARLIFDHGASWATTGRITTYFRAGGLSTSGGAITRRISRDFARSLTGLGVRQARFLIMLRYPFKAYQLLRARARHFA